MSEKQERNKEKKRDLVVTVYEHGKHTKVADKIKEALIGLSYCECLGLLEIVKADMLEEMNQDIGDEE